jgi:hypothetical protein
MPPRLEKVALQSNRWWHSRSTDTIAFGSKETGRLLMFDGEQEVTGPNTTTQFQHVDIGLFENLWRSVGKPSRDGSKVLVVARELYIFRIATRKQQPSWSWPQKLGQGRNILVHISCS